MERGAILFYNIVLLYTIMDNQSIIKIYYYRAKNWVVENENLLVLGAGFVLVTAISFGLGRLWEQQTNAEGLKAPIVVNKAKTAFTSQNQESGIKPARLDGSGGNQEEITNQKLGANMGANILYIASKKGEYYHLPLCPGGKAIKPENKIGFSSKEEAEKAGYKPAKNCPALLK